MTSSTTASAASRTKVSPSRFLAISMVAAAVAALTAYLTVSLSLPLWAMFIGWVGFFTRQPSARNAASAVASIALGVVLGMVAYLAIGALSPMIGLAAFAVVVFVIATLVVSLRTTPVLGNVASCFLGLISFFALHQPPSFATLATLAGAAAAGTFAAWLAHSLQSRLH